MAWLSHGMAITDRQPTTSDCGWHIRYDPAMASSFLLLTWVIAPVLCTQAGKAALGQITPARVRRAIEQTAAPVAPDLPHAALTYGAGLIQV